MSGVDLALVRSVLFAPATRPDLVAKLPRAAPDAAIVDLEDAVPAAHKAEGRELARRALAELGKTGLPVFLRVNPVGSAWWADDLAAARDAGLAGIVVPKLEREEEVELLPPDLPVIAGIETALGVLDVRRVLRRPVVAAYFGAEDLVSDIGGRRTKAGHEVLYARSRVALAARAARLPVFDQVVTQLRDETLFRMDAAVGRDLGYTGKLCIHPEQVEWTNDAFTPGGEELARSRRLVAAWEEMDGEIGVLSFEGEMVDLPAVTRARALIARAR